MFDCTIKRLHSSLSLNESVSGENCYFCSSLLLFLPLPPQAVMCRWVCACQLCSGLWVLALRCRVVPKQRKVSHLEIDLHQPGSVAPL